MPKELSTLNKTIVATKIIPSDFEKHLKKIETQVGFILQKTNKRVYYIVKEKTTPFVPLDVGYLEESLSSIVTDAGSNVQMEEFSYTGKHNPKARGYDYAIIQHEKPFRHPRRGTMKYLSKGMRVSEKPIINVIEKEVQKIIK